MFTLCRLHTAWLLSLGSFHTETHHYSPLLVLIKIIIVIVLKITTLEIQSDCFGIKRSRKRPTDCSLQQALYIQLYGNFALKPLQIREIIQSNNEIMQSRSQSSSAIWDMTSPVKLAKPIALGSKPHLVTRIARTGLGTRLEIM